ncbi:MAG: hypothetical protein WC708_17990 [Lentisphaeria bacterium]
MRKIIRVIFIFLVSVACAIYVFLSIALCRGSYTEWEKGNIHARGMVGFAGFGIKFFRLDIGDKTNHLTKYDNFSIELKDGRRIALADMTIDRISKIKPNRIIEENGSSMVFLIEECA